MGDGERFRFVPCGGDSGAVVGDVFRMPRSSQIHESSEHNTQRSCDCGTVSFEFGDVISVTGTFKHTQSLPRTHVSQETSALGAGLANCGPEDDPGTAPLSRDRCEGG